MKTKNKLRGKEKWKRKNKLLLDIIFYVKDSRHRPSMHWPRDANNSLTLTFLVIALSAFLFISFLFFLQDQEKK